MNRLIKSRLVNLPLSGEILYEIAFVYYFVIVFLQSSTYSDYFTPNTFHYLSYLALGLVLFKIFFLDEQKMPFFIFNIMCLGFLVLTWRTSQSFSLLPMGIFIIGARNVNFRKLIKLYFIVGLILLIFVMFSSEIGVIKNLVYHRAQSNTIRQSFGIVYPTDFAAHVLFLVLAYVYLKFEKLTWITYAMCIVIAYLLILFCDARFSAMALIITIPIVWIGKRAAHDKLISSFIASFYWTVPGIMAYLTCTLAIFFNINNSIFVKLDHLLSGRLMLGHIAYEKYGFSLLGKKVIEHGWGGSKGLAMSSNNPNKYFFIDSSYLRIIIFYGILAFLLTILVMTIISWYSIHRESFDLASIMVIVAISAMVEQRLIDISYDPFLLAIFASVVDLKLKEKNLEKLQY